MGAFKACTVEKNPDALLHPHQRRKAIILEYYGDRIRIAQELEGYQVYGEMEMNQSVLVVLVILRWFSLQSCSSLGRRGQAVDPLIYSPSSSFKLWLTKMQSYFKLLNISNFTKNQELRYQTLLVQYIKRIHFLLISLRRKAQLVQHLALVSPFKAATFHLKAIEQSSASQSIR